MKLIQTEKITRHSHLNLFRADYQDQRGKPRSWIYASRQETPRIETSNWERPDAVVIVPWHVKRQQLVVIREYRVVLGDYQVGFPAGLMDPGETIVETARRELFEETGLILRRVMRCSLPVYSSSGVTDESVSLVYAECDGEPSDAANESSEDIQSVFVSADAAGRLIDDPTLKIDVKTWLVLSEFARHGSIE
ncbi:MAG: NUDIX hydrolase [Desulfobacterales bacterium]|nr:NUDIX hydrolase [Desulfobacterales bacterium]